MDYTINEFFAQFDTLCRKVDQISWALGLNVVDDEKEETIGVAQLAKMLRRTRQALYAQPWLMPNFGEGERKWSYTQIRDWFAVPQEKRKQEYMSRGLRKHG